MSFGYQGTKPQIHKHVSSSSCQHRQKFQEEGSDQTHKLRGKTIGNVTIQIVAIAWNDTKIKTKEKICTQTSQNGVTKKCSI